ncbi:MAG: glycosyltransferase [Planctomycetaceae bacterium]|nr:glycosyltransferase [Planctomycetaceae bacterium]
MADRPLVSTVMIFFNAAQYIEEAIASVLAQTYGSWELLLVDDGSTDKSTQIARRFAGEFPDRIRYLEHDGHANRGMSASRNLGVRHALGQYVAFLDADDVWLPEKLERQIATLESRPQVGLLYAPTEYWYSWTGKPEDQDRDHVPDLDVPLDTLLEPPQLLTRLYPLGTGQAPCMCSLLVRREVFERIGGFEERFLGFYEDQAFLTKVYLSETVYVSSGCWDRYRIHPNSCSAAVERLGQHDDFRRTYLQWFKSYLVSRGVSDSEIWTALDDAMQQLEHTRSSAGRKWYLRVAEGNQAQLIQSGENPDVLRIQILRNASSATYDTQLNLPKLKVQESERCILSFRARADAPREVSLGFAMGRSPWNGLGLHERISLTNEWQPFEREFVVTADEHDARIHFDLGGSDVSVELDAVRLFNPVEGRFIEQPLPPAASSAASRAEIPVEPPVPVNEVDFGSFRRLTPISRDFGCDRGRPIDRYYIENFLERQSDDVRGRVMEIGENTYTRRYGGERVTHSDILHVTEGEPQATIIADLASADHIPSNSFDCIILTQTLQLIYDVPAALRHMYRILKPGGVLLATFPGITQSYDHEWSTTWYWNFTAVSAQRLFAEAFSAENVRVEAFGNVFAAMTFLHGVAVEEVTPEELDYREPGYDITISVRAVKPHGDEQTAAGEEEVRLSQPVRGNRQTESATQAIILMYHRVNRGGTDPFSLCVTPEHFAEQLEVICRQFTPMHLSELAARLNNGGVSRPGVVVTFDDGYVDNLELARPVLEQFGVPATVFITTGYLGGTREFWWDELDRLFLQPGELPQHLQLMIAGTSHNVDLGEDATYTHDAWQQYRTWNVAEPPPTTRHSAFFETWRRLQFLPDDHRQEVLSQLRSWAGDEGTPRATHRQMAMDEVKTLVRGGLVDVGGHTVTHPVLASLTSQEQRQEVTESLSRLNAILERPITSFAYPFGSRPDFNQDTEDILQQAHCTCACSTVPTLVHRRSSLYRLPRFQVDNWSGAEFHSRLAQWLA